MKEAARQQQVLDEKQAQETDYAALRSELEALDLSTLLARTFTELDIIDVYLKHPKTYATQRRSYTQAAYLYYTRGGTELVPTEDVGVTRDGIILTGQLGGDQNRKLNGGKPLSSGFMRGDRLEVFGERHGLGLRPRNTRAATRADLACGLLFFTEAAQTLSFDRYYLITP